MVSLILALLFFGSSTERRICKILGKSFLQNFLLHAYSINEFYFVAILLEFLEYGYTEPRYFVLLLANLKHTTVVYLQRTVQKTAINLLPLHCLSSRGLYLH